MIKRNQKSMKEYDKRKGHISSKIYVSYISSKNIRHPVAKTFTTLHYTSLHFTQLHSIPKRNNTKHSKYKYTYYQNTHTLQNKLKQPQYKIHTKENSHNTIKYPQYKVTLMYKVLLFP